MCVGSEQSHGCDQARERLEITEENEHLNQVGDYGDKKWNQNGFGYLWEWKAFLERGSQKNSHEEVDRKGKSRYSGKLGFKVIVTKKRQARMDFFQ